MLKQTYVALMLKSLLHRLYCRHHELIDRYEICIPQMSRDIYLKWQGIFTSKDKGYLPQMTRNIYLKWQGIFTSNDKGYLPQMSRDIYLKWQGIFTTNDKGYLPQMTRDIYLKWQVISTICVDNVFPLSPFEMNLSGFNYISNTSTVLVRMSRFLNNCHQSSSM